jgi:ABC-type branched-subunit amino acid transport system ATPase component
VSLLAVSEIITGYGPTIVNRGVSLTLAKGEIVTILGPNGAGKSTLLKAIAGLAKPRARAGGTKNFRRHDGRGKSPPRCLFAP